MRSQYKPPARRISSTYDFMGLSGCHITPKGSDKPADMEVCFLEADYVSLGQLIFNCVWMVFQFRHSKFLFRFCLI